MAPNLDHDDIVEHNEHLFKQYVEPYLLTPEKYYYYLQPSQHIDSATEVVIVSRSKLIDYLKTTIFYAASLSEDIMIDDFLVVHFGAEAKINSSGNVVVDVRPDEAISTVRRL
jgi:hypothetical protein